MEEVKVTLDNEIIVDLSGEIDFGKAEVFYNTVMESYQKNPANIRFACENLEFIDSTTLGTFVKILKEVQKNGHRVKLTSLQPKLKKLFVICALDSIMEIA